MAQRILIIDDDAGISRPLKRFLELAGYAVDTAPDGVAGVRACQKCPPDLVITDIHMPDKNGIEVVLEVRHFYPEMPIIAMSGASVRHMLSHLDDARLLGAAHVLEKPFALADMLNVVRRALSATEPGSSPAPRTLGNS